MTRRRDRYWDRQARTYDARTAGIERRFLAHSRRWVCDRATGHTLEIAIGTGANLPHYAAELRLTGVDASAAMLERAAERARTLGRSVDLVRADAADLPFADAAFDTVVCTFGLCCVADEESVITEALRVLRPAGHLLLADHIGSRLWPLWVLQRAAELLSVPLQGEHFTRRPLNRLRARGVTVQETERRTLGIFERVHARAPG